MVEATIGMGERSRTMTYVECARDLTRRIRSIDLRPYETGGRTGVDPDLMNLSLTLHDEAATLFELITKDYESVGSREERREGASGQSISDIAFMARIELQQPREILAQAREAESSWEVLSRANKLLRSTVKALIALEHALCYSEGIEPEQWLEVDIDATIEIRNAYARFHRLMIDLGEQSGLNSMQRLSSAMRLIAELLGSQGARAMRLADRSQLGRFQQAIVAELAGFSSQGRDGADLWDNIFAFSHLMMEINNRDELVQHDRQILGESIELMFGAPGSPERVMEALDRLATIRGRDPLIDRLLDRESIGALREWKRPLIDLHARIGAGAGGAM